MAFTNRNFGIEIEASGLSMGEVACAIARAGFSCEVDEPGEPSSEDWRVVPDGSLDAEDSFEVVSPILSGENGISQVRKVAKALVAAGAGVDQSCGLHVHIDANDLSKNDIVNAVKRYDFHELSIDSFMPRSRRGTRNHYCHPVSDLIPDLVRKSREPGVTVDRLCASVYERYYKLNIAAFIRHGTLEFRQHSGTVNGKKMENWIRFCVNFIEMSKISDDYLEPGLFTGLSPEVTAYFQERTAALATRPSES